MLLNYFEYMPHKLPDFIFERIYWEKGLNVIGIDEVGRGALSGPLTVGAVCFSPIRRGKISAGPIGQFKNTAPVDLGERSKTKSESEANPNIVESIGIDDSKRLSPARRKKLAKIIKESSFAFATTSISNVVIDRTGLTKSMRLAVNKVIRLLFDSSKKLNRINTVVLIDGFGIKYLNNIGFNNQVAIIKGDQKSISIAAASIIAKVERDQNMIKLHQDYPIYGWDKNKGYGTKKHYFALKEYGRSKFHRSLFLGKILR